MASIIQRLPIELRRVIYNCVRPAQKSELLQDIINYKYSIDIVLQRDIILNNLWMFLKDLYDNYYKIWERIPKINNGQNLKFWISNSYSLKDYNSQIKIIWGLLTPQERMEFIKNYN